jgi:hypothetical protein
VWISRKFSDRTAARGALIAAALLIGACVGSQADAPPNEIAARNIEVHRIVGAAAIPSARIIATAQPLQCVPYARRVTDLDIRGDAWTWWQSAEGRYRRDSQPAVGSILALKQTDRLRLGHIAVVSRVLNNREILVEHANWLNRGQIHKHTLVRDTSANNDWSMVRVWYTPGKTLGKRIYAAHGFIHPNQTRTVRLRDPLMQGPDVRLLQEKLAAAGFNVATDGVFGSGTHGALITYQARYGLAEDGVAGPTTRTSLGL